MRFGQTQALDDVSLEIGEGEILALVGENGAGKSTLMNVLYGLYRPDQGTVHVRGEEVRLRSPKDALRLGIGMVHQHFMLVPPLTVAQNVVLGDEPRRRGVVFDQRRAEEEVEATCRRFGFSLDVRAKVEDLSVGSQQKVEIVKALHRGAEVLILDEPTAVLTPQEADELFAVARGLARQGRTVIFISHKLREVLAVAERIAVLRRGRKVAEVRAGETTAEALAERMVGEPVQADPVQAERSREAAESKPRGGQHDAPSTTGLRPSAQAERGAPSLQVRALSARRADGTWALRGVDLDVHPGEIVGIAGVDGNGQRELAEVLTGLRPGQGSARFGGRELLGLSPESIRSLGVGHVPEDRLLRAVVGPMSVEENLALGRHRAPPYGESGFIAFRGRRAEAVRLMEAYDVRPRDPTLRIRALSGGNQQKVVLARELDAAPGLLVIVQPTRGLDIAAVAQVHRRLREHRDAGNGVLLISLDLEEVLALSDRTYVLFEGQVTGHLHRAGYDERRMGRLMLGAKDDPPPAPGAAHG